MVVSDRSIAQGTTYILYMTFNQTCLPQAEPHAELTIIAKGDQSTIDVANNQRKTRFNRWLFPCRRAGAKEARVATMTLCGFQDGAFYRLSNLAITRSQRTVNRSENISRVLEYRG